MKQAIIDVGSNSIHLTAYDIHKKGFKTLFHSKRMVGLAGYVENGSLSPEGIRAAAETLTDFKGILHSLSIDRVAVFATASLRNVDNTEKAVKALYKETGFSIQVLSGSEEAMLSYRGAMLDVPMATGAFVDVGGASTELISFENGRVLSAESCRIGSLSLYKKCVGKVLSGAKATERMTQLINAELSRLQSTPPRDTLVCVGGTARMLLKIAGEQFALTGNTVSSAQLETLLYLFLNQDKKAIRMLLRLGPERVHTFVPGLFLLSRILHLYGSREIIVSSYGVREGFLCQKIIPS